MEQLINTPYSPTSLHQQINIKQILSKQLYHWPLFAVCLLLTLTLAFGYLSQIKSVYPIKARLAIYNDKNQLPVTKAPNFFEGEAEVLKSRPLIRKVVEELQLWISYTEPGLFKDQDLYTNSPVQFELIKPGEPLQETDLKINIISRTDYMLTMPDGSTSQASFNEVLDFKFGEWRLKPTSQLKGSIGKTILVHLKNQENTITKYQNEITTAFNKSTPVIELSLKDEIPDRGAKILNHLIMVYKDFNVIDKNEETKSNLIFVDDRLALLSEDLLNIEKETEKYKNRSLSTESQFYLDNVRFNDNRLDEFDLQLNVIAEIERFVNLPNGKQLPVTLGITDPELVNLISQLSKLQLEYSRLQAITMENNPSFVPLNLLIKKTGTAIKKHVNTIKNSLYAAGKQLNSLNSGYEADLINVSDQERQHLVFNRQKGIKENMYVYLLDKREEVALIRASTLPPITKSEEAYYGAPETKSKLPVVIALICGFLIPAAVIKGRRAFSNRILSKNDIVTATTVPVISELILSKNKSAFVASERNTVGEKMRALRTSILRTDDKKGNVILITSGIAKEGKSYVASNIAAAVASMGRKSIILEMDFRKPQISKIFKLDKNHPGLTEYIYGGATKEEITIPSDAYPNLFFMKSGHLPANPSDLLKSRKINSLLQELRKDFNNIIIDSPPLHLVSDAMILSPLCDLTLYLVRYNFTPKSEIKFIEEVYKEKRLSNMNLILNGVKTESLPGYAPDLKYEEDESDPKGWSAVFFNFSSRF